jgi:hypothetical protein
VSRINLIVYHFLQAQNDDFSAIFNLEDYKGWLGIVIICTLSVCLLDFFKHAFDLLLLIHIIKCVKNLHTCYAYAFRA